MKQESKSKKIGKAFLFLLFLIIAAIAIIAIILSKQCGGSNEIKQNYIEIPTTESTTSTTTITTTTSTTTTTTTTEVKIDYEMQIDMDDIAEHKAVNPDVIGWIYIKDTIIDYPILQSVDNNKYIHADWTGSSSFAGCIYEDYRGDIDDTNLTLLYGHNMAAGTMFSAIKNYINNEEWGKEHKYIEIASEEKRYLYEVISVNILYGEEGADFGYWMPSQPTTLNLKKSDFEKYISNVKSTANILYCKKNKFPKYGDHIIGLQTCNSGNNDGMRCVVFAKCLGER